jgi:peptide deformylase
MAVRDILIYPQHKAELRRKSESIAGLNRRVRRLILDLKDTLLASSDGTGLAAPWMICLQSRENERGGMVRGLLSG